MVGAHPVEFSRFLARPLNCPDTRSTYSGLPMSAHTLSCFLAVDLATHHPVGALGAISMYLCSISAAMCSHEYFADADNAARDRL